MQEYLDSITWPSPADARWIRSSTTMYLEWSRVIIPCADTWRVSLGYKSIAENPWVETPLLEISLSLPLSEEILQEQFKAIAHETKKITAVLFP